MPANTRHRPLADIAREIRRTWRPINFAAVPYVDAMAQLDQITDTYIAESAASVVRYFLSNAGSWRGEDAKRIKAELKGLL